MTTDKAHKSLRSFRYIPVAVFLLMFWHVIMLNFGVDCHVCEIVVILAGFYIAYAFSITFGFCLLHRMMIYYALTVMACIWIRRFPNGENGLFGDYIREARFVMLIYGCVLFWLLLMKRLRRKKRAE